jgi:hypothetical protein
LIAFPGVGEEKFEFAWFQIGEAAEDIAEILPDVEVVAEGTGDDRVDDRNRPVRRMSTVGADRRW